MQVLTRYALFVLILALLYLLLTGNLLSRSPLVIAAQLAAIWLMVWARRSFRDDQFSIFAEPTGQTVLSQGPYHYIRHPMYAAALLLVWASILGHPSPVNIVIGLLLTGMIALRITTEEALLRAQYPDYAAYAQKTKRIIPYVL